MRPQRNLAMTPTVDAIASWQQNHATILAGNVSFGASTGNAELDRNIDCWKASGVTPTAATEFAVAHSLGRVPIGFIVIYQDQESIFWASTTAWTKTNIYLKCSNAGVNYRLLII